MTNQVLSLLEQARTHLANLSGGQAGKLCIYCTGLYGRQFLSLLRVLELKADQFSDSYSGVWGQEIEGVRCVPPDEIDKESTLVIVANKNPAAIVEALRAKEFPMVCAMQEADGPLRDAAAAIAGGYGARLCAYMAQSGAGTDRCLELGGLPVPVHFYQPIPELRDLEERKIWDRVSDLPGIHWRPEAYLAHLEALAEFADECDWPAQAADDPMQFYTDNGAFSYGCASFLHSTIRKYKPRRIIEVGSGNSSRVFAAAIAKNAAEGHPAEYTVIDPYSRLEMERFPKGSSLLRERVELVPPELFEKLGENDILFIDSSHTVRIGGDVNFLILDVLPRLAEGVIVHLHDIPMPYEYLKVYATNPDFRVFWTESYLLQAFLACNRDFEILAPVAWILREREARFRDLFPGVEKAGNWFSESFWIRRGHKD